MSTESLRASQEVEENPEQILTTYLETNRERAPNGVESVKFEPDTKLAVIIPAYKEAAYIPTTIQEVTQNIGLSPNEYALIIIDNNDESADSEELAETGTTTVQAVQTTFNNLHEVDPALQLFLIDEKNLRGVKAATEAGIYASMYGFLGSETDLEANPLVIARTDADSTITGNWGQKILANFQSNPDMGFVYGKVVEKEVESDPLENLSENEKEAAHEIANLTYKAAQLRTAMNKPKQANAQSGTILPSANIAFSAKMYARANDAIENHKGSEANSLQEIIEAEGGNTALVDDLVVETSKRLSDRVGLQSKGGMLLQGLNAIREGEADATIARLKEEISLLEQGIDPIEQQQRRQRIDEFLQGINPESNSITGSEIKNAVLDLLDGETPDERTQKALDLLDENPDVEENKSAWVDLLANQET